MLGQCAPIANTWSAVEIACRQNQNSREKDTAVGMGQALNIKKDKTVVGNKDSSMVAVPAAPRLRGSSKCHGTDGSSLRTSNSRDAATDLGGLRLH